MGVQTSEPALLGFRRSSDAGSPCVTHPAPAAALQDPGWGTHTHEGTRSAFWCEHIVRGPVLGGSSGAEVQHWHLSADRVHKQAAGDLWEIRL